MSGILQRANKPGAYLVPSEADADRYYEVDEASGQCDCPAWVWRHSADHSLCKHGKALKAYLEERGACPGCNGRGWLITQFRFQSGSNPIPCSVCEGSGKRADADPRLAAVADQFRAEVRDRELQEVFK